MCLPQDFHIIQSHNICSFVPGFFHPAYFKNSSMLLCITKNPLVFCEVVYHCIDYYNLFIHSQTDENLEYMQFLCIISKIAMNNNIQVFAQMLLFPLDSLEVELLGHMICMCLSRLQIAKQFFSITNCQTVFQLPTSKMSV